MQLLHAPSSLERESAAAVRPVEDAASRGFPLRGQGSSCDNRTTDGLTEGPSANHGADDLTISGAAVWLVRAWVVLLFLAIAAAVVGSL